MSPEADGLLLLMRLEADAHRRRNELEDLREIRLRARVAGRVDQMTSWQSTPEEEDDLQQLEALRRFAPTPWWKAADE